MRCFLTPFRRRSSCAPPCTEIHADVPIFATSISAFNLFNHSNELLKADTDITSARWNVLQFDQIIPTAQQVTVQPCGHCFCNLVLLAEDEA